MKIELRDRKVTVVGLARSGVGAANLLAGMGAAVTVTDLRSEAELAGPLDRLAPSVRLVLGCHPENLFMSAQMIVVSPGVPLEMKQIVSAKAAGIPVIGELELAYQIVEGAKGTPFLGVTGSNGKSTTTTLLELMLRKGGFKTLLGGNIGNALSEEILKRTGVQKGGNADKIAGPDLETMPDFDFVVVEVSSFQLDSIDRFHPHIAVVLNVTPDHLDRYHSMAEYSSSKARIFENQTGGDFILLNADDPETTKIGNERSRLAGGPDLFYFSRSKKVKGMYYRDGQIYCNIPALPGLSDHPFIEAGEIKIKGVHNLENAMAASAMALLAGCPKRAVIESLREFPGLEHRLEFVRELDGVRYINDSKGTNVGAVMKSVESFDGPVVLIAGGRDKAGDFSALRDLVSRKVKALVLIGEAAEKISGALGDATDTVMARDLKDAVARCREKAAKGDVILLSPACASFDMFRDFEDRGRQFKKIVAELAG